MKHSWSTAGQLKYSWWARFKSGYECAKLQREVRQSDQLLVIRQVTLGTLPDWKVERPPSFVPDWKLCNCRTDWFAAKWNHWIMCWRFRQCLLAGECAGSTVWKQLHQSLRCCHWFLIVMPNFGIVWFVVYYHRTGLIVQWLHCVFRLLAQTVVSYYSFIIYRVLIVVCTRQNCISQLSSQTSSVVSSTESISCSAGISQSCI